MSLHKLRWAWISLIEFKWDSIDPIKLDEAQMSVNEPKRAWKHSNEPK